MPKTTWTLELKSTSAQRDARALRRELQSLQGALEDVDAAAQRAGRSMGGGGGAGYASAQRRVRAERQVAIAQRDTITAQERAEARRQAELHRALAEDRRREDRNQADLSRAMRDRERQDQQRRVRAERDEARRQRELYQALRGEDRERQRLADAGRRRREREDRDGRRVAAAVDRAGQMNARRAERDQRRREAQSARAWQGELRHHNRAARAEIQREGRADRAWRADMRRRGAAVLHEQRLSDRAARARLRDFRQDRADRRSGWGSAFGAAGMTLGVAGGIAGATIGAASALADMVASAARLTLSIGEGVLQMIAFREASLATLRMMNGGNASVAAEQYQFARQFARETPLDTQQVLELQQQVSTAGFRGQQNRDVVLAGADVGAANPNDSTAASRYVRAVSQIRNAGRLRAQEMNQLGEVGIGRRELLLSLGRQTNVRRNASETEDAYVARLQQMQESGRFTGDQGVAAAQDVVRRQFSGGRELGSGARSQGDTLLGTLSNLRGAVFDLITGIDGIENLPGVRALKATLNGIANTLAGTTATGKRLQGIVSTIVNDVGMLVGGGLADFDATLNSTLDAGKDILPIVRDIAGAFGGGALAAAREQFGGIGATFRETFGNRAAVAFAGQLGRSMVMLFGYGARVTGQLAAIAGLVTVIAGHLVPLLQGGQILQSLQSSVQSFLAPVTLGDQVRAAMGGVGDQAVLGIRQGLQRSAPGLQADVAAMAQSIPATASSNLQIKSPSRVMADEVGRYIPEGIALGIDRGRGALDAAMGDLVPVPGVPAAGALGGLGGVSIGAVTIQVTGGAGEESGRAAARGFVDELVALLEVPALAG